MMRFEDYRLKAWEMWRLAALAGEEETPFALSSVAICFFGKKECGSELGIKGKLSPSYQMGPTNLNKFLLKKVNSCKDLSLA